MMESFLLAYSVVFFLPLEIEKSIHYVNRKRKYVLNKTN